MLNKMTEMEIIEIAIENAQDMYSQMENDEICPNTGCSISIPSENNVEKLKQIAEKYEFVQNVEVNYDEVFEEYTLSVDFSRQLSCYNTLVFEMYLYAKNDYEFNN